MKKTITSLIIFLMMITSMAWGADTMRISALPAVTSITPETDVIPIVASGSTRKITVSNLLSNVGSGTVTGTGTQYYIPYWSSTTALGSIYPNTSGYVLTSNGPGSAPTFQAVSAGSGTVTGTGTNHYWPYWTGTSSLGAKSITASRPVCTDSSGDPATCTYSPIVTLWGSGSCSGYLKSDGTCDTPTGSGTVTGSGTQYYIAYWSSTTGIASIAPSTSGYVLTSNGAGSPPSFQAASGTGNITGSGVQYYIPYWSSTTGLGALTSLGTSGYVLTSNGAGTLPTWQAPTGSVSDTAYASSWNGVTTIAPSKNAIYDYLESKMPTGADGSYTESPAARSRSKST